MLEKKNQNAEKQSPFPHIYNKDYFVFHHTKYPGRKAWYLNALESNSYGFSASRFNFSYKERIFPEPHVDFHFI
jgi:hypothetical protein